LGAGLARNAAAHERDLVQVVSRLSPLLLQRPQQAQHQGLGALGERLAAGLARNAEAHNRDYQRVAARLSPALLERPQKLQEERLSALAGRLQPAAERRLALLAERLGSLGKLHASVDPDRPLERGFARVTRADGSVVRQGASLAAGEAVDIKFGDRVSRQAVIDGVARAPASPAQRPAPRKAPTSSPAQGDLF
jgi:exodeoxyribonuclease VII large subunit